MVRKHVKIENLGTTNSILMKYASYMYHLNNFQLLKTKGCELKGGKGLIPSYFE